MLGHFVGGILGVKDYGVVLGLKGALPALLHASPVGAGKSGLHDWASERQSPRLSQARVAAGVKTIDDLLFLGQKHVSRLGEPLKR
jgi:hypothetical protein